MTTAPPKDRRLLPVFTKAAVVLFLGYMGWRWIAWERWHQEGSIVLANGTMINVVESGRQMRFWGHPHLFGFGGGHPTHVLEFSTGNGTLKWKGPFIPLALQFDKGCPVLAVFDRETDFAHITFRYYRFQDGAWEERPFREFPPELAWQNLWLKRYAGSRADGTVIDEYAVLRQRDPDGWDFRNSLTAKMWWCIETGQQYWQIKSEAVESKVLRDYMTRHSIRTP